MKYFSMFSGIGTGEKGIEQAFDRQPNMHRHIPDPDVGSNNERTSGGDGAEGSSRNREDGQGTPDVLPDNGPIIDAGGKSKSELVEDGMLPGSQSNSGEEDDEKSNSDIRNKDRGESSLYGRGDPMPGSEPGKRQSPSCIGYSEIDKYAEAIYRYHYPDHRNYGDATKLVSGELPDFDLLIGGFPCQSFSIAGQRKGFTDTRGTLFFEIARILSDKRPGHLVLENVKGLLSHDNGQTIQRILGVLTDLGYRVEWTVLNSKHFGVPQNRERIFLIGHLEEGCSEEILSFGNSHEETEDGDRGLIEVGHSGTGGERGRIWHTDGISATLTGTDYKQAQQIAEPVIGTKRDFKGKGYGFRTMSDNMAPTLNARAREDGSGQPIVAVPVLTPDRPVTRQNGRRFKEDGDPSFTLTAQDQHGVMQNAQIRRLTPVECERLQGLPDDWTQYGRFEEIEAISDTQRYKTLGNAFTVNVIEAISRRMREKGCIN